MGFGPVIRKELVKLTSFEGVDSGEHISHVSQWVNTILLGGDNQGQVDGGSLATGIGAHEQVVFASQDKLLDGTFRGIVADIEVRIIQEPGQGNPMVESVIDSLHQGVLRAKGGLKLKQFFFQLIKQRSGCSLALSQSFLRCLALNLLFHIVQLLVYVKNLKANISVEWQALVKSSASMSIAANFNLAAIGKESIKTTSCVCLNKAREDFEKQLIAFKRQVWGEVKDSERILSIAKVWSHLTFAHFPLELSILDFYYSVVSLNYFGGKHPALQKRIERLDSQGGSKYPVAEGRARNGSALPLVDLLQAIKGREVAIFANNYMSKQSWSGQSFRDGRAWFFCGDDMLLTFRTSSYFLLMLQTLQRLRESVQLVSDFLANWRRINEAVRAQHMVWINYVRDRLSWEILVQLQNMFGVCRFTIINSNVRALWNLLLCLPSKSRDSRPRVVLFSLLSKVTFVALLDMDKQNIKFALQFLKLLPELCIAVKRFFKKLSDAFIFFPQSQEFVAFRV